MSESSPLIAGYLTGGVLWPVTSLTLGIVGSLTCVLPVCSALCAAGMSLAVADWATFAIIWGAALLIGALAFIISAVSGVVAFHRGASISRVAAHLWEKVTACFDKNNLQEPLNPIG